MKFENIWNKYKSKLKDVETIDKMMSDAVKEFSEQLYKEFFKMEVILFYMLFMIKITFQ